MNTLHEIKAERQKRTDTLLNECLVFFAFSNEQFTANKTPLQDGEKYVSIGAGGYMPKSKADLLSQGFKDIDKWYKAAIKSVKGLRYANIAYELANHEAYYTGEITDTLQALGSGYTAKEVWGVWYKESKKQEAA